jgi:hypothetical protein
MLLSVPVVAFALILTAISWRMAIGHSIATERRRDRIVRRVLIVVGVAILAVYLGWILF